MATLSACKKSKKFQRLTALRGALAFTAAALALSFTVANPRIAEAKYAAIVVDAGTGVVRHEANADDRNSPASLTKLMTLYLLFEAIENKRLSWTTPMTASRHAANQSPTHLALSPGETITAKDAALAVIIHSANDAIGRGRWSRKLTVAYIDKTFVVAGYTYNSRDTLDLSAHTNCDVNLLTGRGIKNQKPFKTAVKIVPVADWSEGAIPRECRD